MEDFIGIFLDEGLELVEKFNIICLQIERDGPSVELINKSFRIIHTIKGSGAAVGLTGIAETAHRFETELDAIRRLPPTSLSEQTISRWLQWGDYLEGYLRGLRNHHEFVPLTLPPAALEDEARKDALISPIVELEKQAHANQADGKEKRDDGPSHLSPQDVAASEHLFFRSYIVGSSELKGSTIKDHLSLAALALPHISPAAFSPSALDLLREHCDLSEISRVCLVKRLGLSNQFEVVSSATEGDTNSMRTGGRCFVNPRSSVFSIKPGMMRVLQFEKVALDFEARKLQPQRALNRLASKGFKSGICVALTSGRHMNGLLFLNSFNDFCLNFPREKLPTLASLVLHATRQIHGHCELNPIYFHLWDITKIPVLGEKFSINSLKATFDTIAPIMNAAPVKFLESQTREETLVSHANVAFILSLFGSHRGVEETHVRIFEAKNKLVFECEPKGQAAPIHYIQWEAIKQQAFALGFSISRFVDKMIRFESELDLQWQPVVKYST